jgi:hypothetical protein
LMAITLNLWIALVRIVFSTILILSTHEHGRSSHILQFLFLWFWRFHFRDLLPLIRFILDILFCCCCCELDYFPNFFLNLFVVGI